MERGESYAPIQAQLGRASIQTTLDRYGHLLPETQQDIGERLDTLVFGSTDPSRANGVLTQPAAPVSISSHHPQDHLDPPAPPSR